MRRLLALILITMMVAPLLAACNLPFLQTNTAAVQTEAALTVQAQLTAVAPAKTPTSTTAPFPSLPPVTATVPSATLPPPPTSTSTCDRGTFISDVTYPDNAPVDAGTSFTKTWRLKNIGSCLWTTSYSLVFTSGDVMGGPAAQALTGIVNPGQTVDLSVNLTAPATNGTYKGNWGLRNGSGVIFYSGFYVQIVVGGGGGSPFAVTHVNYVLSTWSDGSHTNCPRVKATITTNAAGTITYHWVRSDGPDATQTLIFGAAGTQSLNYDWARGSANAGSPTWVGIYIDDPNHQDFGHLDFDTACTSP
jgi:hypothetical protein